MSKTINLGRVTAYADAVAAGYTGTREQFANDLANAANYAAEAGDAAETATEAATTASTAAETATDKAEEASADAEQAHADAQAILVAKETAVAAANTASSKAGEAANSAQQAAASETAAAGSATTASNAATSATASKNAAAASETNAANSASQASQTLTNVNQAGATQVAAIQAKGTEVLNSIPADYTELSNDVDDLKSDLNAVEELTIKKESITETDSIKSELTWTDGYYMDASGDSHSSGTYSYSSEIPVVEGNIIATGGYNEFRFLTAYANGSAVSDKGSNNSFKTYTVPSGITSVIVTMTTERAQSSTVDVTLTHTEIITSNILDEDIEALQSDVAGIRTSIENIPAENLDTVTRTGHNYLEDISEEHENQYWNGSTVGGSISLMNNSYYVAVLLPISRHGIYNYYDGGNNIRFVHYLDNDKKLLLYDSSPGKIIDATSESIKYVAITCSKSRYATATIVFGDEAPYDRYSVSGQWVFNDLLIDSPIHAYLPPEICVGVGRTIELYNNLVCLEADKYHLYWSCSVGVAYGRKFSIVGTENNVGTYPLTLNIYDDELNVVKSLTSTVKVIENEIASALNILPIGDSLTNEKAWLEEVQNLSSDKIAYIGTRSRSGLTYAHEGRSGASAAWYNADSTYTFDSNYVGNPEISGTSNPFWDGTKFSLAHYISTQASTIGTPDAVQLLLGTNGMALNPTTNVNNIKAIVDSIIDEYPNMPIFVCNTIYRSNQDGYHSTGADGYVAVSGFQFSEDVKVMNLQKALSEALADYSNVHMVPLSVCMDRDNDFGQVEVPVNPRLTTVTTHIANESVHPQTAGYMQMADVIYSSYIAHLS